MPAKKYIYMVLMLLLSMVIAGCSACDRCEDGITTYRGDPDPFKGTYLVSLKQETQSTTDKLLGKEPERRKIEQTMDISVKDPKTLVAKFGPDGEPFYLDYNEKTGIAKGKDSQGYEWEIAFGVEFIYRWEEDSIVMYSIKRKRTSLLGVGSDNAEGESKTSIFYKEHKHH